MLSKKPLTRSILSALIFCTPAAIASDNPSSHQHGHAELQLAFNDNRIDLLLVSPADTLFGFEHLPRTPEQRQTAESVTQWLGENPLVNTPDSTCTVQAGTVQHETESHNDHDGHDHGDREQHTDIEVTQILVCPGLSTSTSLTTPLTNRFPALEHLNIAWAGPDGQGAARLKLRESSFKLRR
ncbi:MAG: ZrgA family zinc uptake protein [Marinobacter sp.]